MGDGRGLGLGRWLGREWGWGFGWGRVEVGCIGKVQGGGCGRGWLGWPWRSWVEVLEGKGKGWGTGG